MGSTTEEDEGGFESVFRLVGGRGRFQWWALALCSFQLVVMTWNHMGYIFIGAVPQHWCHISDLESSSWTVDQIKNISIPKIYSSKTGADDFKYDKCQYYDLDYKDLLAQSNGNFEDAYLLALRQHGHNDQNENSALKTCQSWSYDRSIYTETLVSQLDLVCGRRYMVGTLQAVYMVGALVGNLVFGPLNDNFLGRRRTTLVGSVLVLVGGFFTSMSTSYVMFIASRCLIALGAAGNMQAASVWLLEHCDIKTRALANCVKVAFWGVGLTIMPLYAYYIRTWSNLQLAWSISTLTLLSYYWLYPESPRWLASRGRDEEAVTALQNIAKFNRMDPQPSRTELLRLVKQCHSKESPETNDANSREKSKGMCNKCLETVSSVLKNFHALVSTPELRRTSFTLWILFAAIAFVYYGFAFSGTTITANTYLLVTVGALMDIPAPVALIPFFSRWGRRPTTIGCYIGTGIAALAIALTPASYEGVRTLMYMSGKFFVSAGFTAVYLVITEAYPTVVRSTGRGTGALMGRIGSTIAPYVADMLTTVYADLPSVIFCVVAFITAPIGLFLPETKDDDLKDQVQKVKRESVKDRNKSAQNDNLL